jgi:hypothetical protein
VLIAIGPYGVLEAVALVAGAKGEAKIRSNGAIGVVYAN